MHSHVKSSEHLSPVAYALHFALFHILRLIHFLRSCLSSIAVAVSKDTFITLLFAPLISAKSAEKPFARPSLPPHVAFSCPGLSNQSTCDHHVNSDQPSTSSPPTCQNAVASFVYRLMNAGVHHVTVFDPVAPVDVSQFCDSLHDIASRACLSLPASKSTVKQMRRIHSARPFRHLVRVSEVTPQATLQSEVLLPLCTPLSPDVDEHGDDYITCGVAKHISSDPIGKKKATVDDDEETEAVEQLGFLDEHANDDDATENDDDSTSSLHDDTSFTLSDTNSSSTSFHLTFIRPHTGRASIAHAARHLICERSSAASMSIDDIRQWLDRHLTATVLPSEPDVLVLFPASRAPPIPVLGDFPVWHLRLTQFIFADRPPHRMSCSTLFDVVASAASAPKRFGR